MHGSRVAGTANAVVKRLVVGLSSKANAGRNTRPAFASATKIEYQRGGVFPVASPVELTVPPGGVLPTVSVSVVPPVISPVVPAPVELPVVPAVVEPDVELPEVAPRLRLRAFDVLCGSVDVVAPVLLVGGPA